jgi:hypothetical protein
MEKKSKLGTIVHGIGASEHLDTAGEIIDIKGLDISSLGGADSVLNWEHNSKQNPVQVCGKITFAKKIFKESDCSNNNEKKFWNKCKKPFVYVKGELFDHPELGHDGAKNVAAMLRYNNKDKGDSARNLISLSIEGGKIEKKGMVITKSIARDVALTIKHANHMCVVEILDDVKEREQLYKQEDILVDLKKEENVLGFKQKADSFKNAGTLKQKVRSTNEINSQVAAPKADVGMTADREFRSTPNKGIQQKPVQNNKISYLEPVKEKKVGSPSMQFKPNKEFTPSQAPNRMKTGDRINYLKEKKPVNQPNIPNRQFSPENALKKISAGDRINHNQKRPVIGKTLYSDPDFWKSESNLRKALVAGIMNSAPEGRTGVAALSSEDLDGVLHKPFKSKKEKKIEKNQPSFSVPKMGIENKPDMQVKQIDPKKTYTTKEGKTYTQGDVEGKKIAAKQRYGVRQDYEAKGKDPSKAIEKIKAPEVQADKFKRGSGVNTKSKYHNDAYAYSGKNNMSPKEMGSTKGRGNYPSTKHHEGLHRTLGEVARRTSKDHSSSVVNHILDNMFDKQQVEKVNAYVDKVYGKNSNKEETLTHVLDLLTSGKKRKAVDSFLSQNKMKPLDYGNLKQGWKNTVKFGESLDENKINEIHGLYSPPKMPEKTVRQKVVKPKKVPKI